MSIPIRPAHKRLAVRRVEAAKKTASGLYIPDAAQEKQAAGTVVAIGKEVDLCEIGETVLFAKYSGSDVTVDGEELVVINQDDVLLVMR